MKRTRVAVVALCCVLSFLGPVAVASPVTEKSLGVVVDNPMLSLVVADGENLGYQGPDAGHSIYFPSGGLYLVNSQTGERTRIDVDSTGSPLVPSWTGQGCEGGDECLVSADPVLRTSVDSVSRDGQRVAFCTNYSDSGEALLYVKNLASGRLTQTSVRCGVWHFQEEDDPFIQSLHSPVMSDDGRVVQVVGDRVDDHMRLEVGWGTDTLYFTDTGKVRKLNGQGTMTRDGGTVFLRLGSQSLTGRKRASTKVAEYSVGSGRTKLLPWWRSYFDGSYPFGAPRTMMTRRGRYLVNRQQVMDRTRGITVDIASIVRQRGYEFSDINSISNDGTTIFVRVVTYSPGPYWTYNDIAVTNWGWQPMARATLTAKYGRGDLLVDVDPNKGSGYWTFTLQRLTESGRWESLPGQYKTHGRQETLKIGLPPDTYRVIVHAKYGYRGYISDTMTVHAALTAGGTHP